MRKITRLAKEAFFYACPFSQSNTIVAITERKSGDVVNLFLHGHCIATRLVGQEDIRFCMCGWGTPTTRERLKAADVLISQRKGLQYHISPVTREETLIDENTVYEQDRHGNIKAVKQNY